VLFISATGTPGGGAKLAEHPVRQRVAPKVAKKKIKNTCAGRFELFIETSEDLGQIGSRFV